MEDTDGDYGKTIPHMATRKTNADRSYMLGADVSEDDEDEEEEEEGSGVVSSKPPDTKASRKSYVLRDAFVTGDLLGQHLTLVVR